MIISQPETPKATAPTLRETLEKTNPSAPFIAVLRHICRSISVSHPEGITPEQLYKTMADALDVTSFAKFLSILTAHEVVISKITEENPLLFINKVAILVGDLKYLDEKYAEFYPNKDK